MKVMHFLACFLGLMHAAPAQAQNWPQRPITILMAFPAGTIVDVAMRAVARELTTNLGQSVVIENRVGGAGIVALKAVMQAAPDGYTFGHAAVGPAAIRPILDKDVGFDFDKDFTPVIMLGDIPNTLIINPKIDVKTVREFADFARTHPDVTMAHSGPGTIGQLAGILFAQKAGLKFNYVVYRGSGGIITDLLSGQIHAGFPPYNPEAKNVKILAVATEKRMSFLPDVPTMTESGYPDVIATTWNALVGPKEVPPEVVEKFNAALNAVIGKPEMRDQFAQLGFNFIGGKPDVVTNQVGADRRRWSAILRENNITFER